MLCARWIRMNPRDEVLAVTLPNLREGQAVELARAWLTSYAARQDVPADRNMIVAGAVGARMPEDVWDEMLPVLLQPVAERAVWPVVRALDGRGIGRLIVSPNRALHVFPLHACRLPDGLYLADAYEVIYTPSLSILRRCADRRRCGRDRIFLVENPTGDLLFTEAEGASLRCMYPEHAVRRGPQATREQLLRGSVDCHVLHYSGHAVFDLLDPLNSALVLGSKGDAGQWLTLRDIFCRLHLRENWLTVISGCESGMLLPDRVDEFVGLPSGFLYAGAACVLSTLWAVHDLSTALLMDRFHTGWLGGLGVGAALREAQRWLRDDIGTGPELRDAVLPDLLRKLEDEDVRQACEQVAEEYARRHPDTAPFASPVHWAPFIATGLAYALEGVPS
jgi:CHAT domain-containing protein